MTRKISRAMTLAVHNLIAMHEAAEAMEAAGLPHHALDGQIRRTADFIEGRKPPHGAHKESGG